MSKTRRNVSASANGYANRLQTLDVLGQNKVKEDTLELKQRPTAKTSNQKRYLNLISDNDITICTGPAGSGKTHLAVGMAAEYLVKEKVSKIFLVRPTVTCDEDLGHLPGELLEKLGPYLRPAFDELLEFFGEKQLNSLVSGKFPKIEGVPLGMLKGRTFKNAFVILDEAQDATYKQLKNFLTRMGHGTKMVLTGDTTQSDLTDRAQDTALENVMIRLEGAEGVGFSRLTPGDIQRHLRTEQLLERL